jgi:hypothetical protein
MKTIDKKKKEEFPSDYTPFLQDILTEIQSVRYQMQLSVSKQTLLLYWEIGRGVSEKIEKAGWGNSVVEKLAKDLQTEIPGVRGFAVLNKWNMKRFCDFYAQWVSGTNRVTFHSTITVAKLHSVNNSAIVMAELQPKDNQIAAIFANSATTAAEFQKHIYELVTGIGWTQNCIILEKFEDLKLTRKEADRNIIESKKIKYA